jgi:hypothetical protein
MPSINGVDFNNISSINGVSWNSVSNICGVPVSHGASCTPISLGYSDGRKFPPEYACTASPFFYDFDSINQLLYTSNNCGISFAGAGYYSDGVDIYYWDGAEIWTYFSACGR